MDVAVVQRRVLGVLRWVTIVVLALVTIFPFYYMVLLSFVPVSEILQNPGRLLVPFSDITFKTYGSVLSSPENGGQGFGQFMRNSGIVAICTVIITLAISTLGAYAVARLDFFGKRKVTVLFLAVYLFPAVVLAGPLYIAFAKIGLTASLVGLTIIYVALTVPVSIHMLRGYFATIPVSVEEAAMIDGCGRFAMLRRVTLPLSMPSLMSTGLYIFMIAWNEFLFALLFLTADRDKWTVSLGLSQLTNGIEVPKTTLMAGSVILTVPIVLLYGIAERTLTEGRTSGADKG